MDGSACTRAADATCAPESVRALSAEQVAERCSSPAFRGANESRTYYGPVYFFGDTEPFMTLAARMGLVTIWQQTDRWPDFCNDRDVTYDCRVEAKRARPLVVSTGH